MHRPQPKSLCCISEEQIYFLDLLILFCLLSDSPDITESESIELFKTHKTIVNEGRSSEAFITTLKGKISIREEVREYSMECKTSLNS